MQFAHAIPHWFRCFPVVFFLALCPSGASHSNRLMLAIKICKVDYG